VTNGRTDRETKNKINSKFYFAVKIPKNKALNLRNFNFLINKNNTRYQTRLKQFKKQRILFKLKLKSFSYIISIETIAFAILI
jgi:hypothetical protein